MIKLAVIATVLSYGAPAAVAASAGGVGVLFLLSHYLI